MPRDLRARDNAALAHALQAAGTVHCAFVFDRAQARAETLRRYAVVKSG
jgi:deoxyribodipyrimidine photolyase